MLSKPTTKVQLLIHTLLTVSLVTPANHALAADAANKTPIKTMIPSMTLDLSKLPKNISTTMEVDATAKKTIKTRLSDDKGIDKEASKTAPLKTTKTDSKNNTVSEPVITKSKTPIISAKPVDTLITSRSLMTDKEKYDYVTLPSSDSKLSSEAIKPRRNFQQCQFAIFNENNAITLDDVLLKSFCKNPAISQAIASIEENQFSVQLAEAAYRPNVSINGEFATNRIPSNNSGAGSATKSITGSFNLSWVLFDFGVRNANLESARHMLSSAIATQGSATLTALIESLRIYSEALTAYSNLQALSQAEAVAQKSMAIVQAQYDAKIVGLSEIMQAKTALARASLERSQANGLWLSNRGQLAVALDMPVQSAIKLADSNMFFATDEHLADAMELLKEAKTLHPRVLASKAEIESLKQSMLSINRQFKGSLSFSGSAARTQSYDDFGNSLGQNTLGLSVQANIPLFTGKERNAREGQVQAQINSREALVSQIQDELSNDIWRNATDIKTTQENLQAAKLLLEAADKNYEVALGRYQAGIGNISDLLVAQTALANAQQQLQSTKISHFQSRIRLAMAVGRLSLPLQNIQQ